MKGLKRLLAVVIGSALAACTTSPQQPALQSQEMSLADQYRSAVQAGAERKGVQVYWINPPESKDLKGSDSD